VDPLDMNGPADPPGRSPLHPNTVASSMGLSSRRRVWSSGIPLLAEERGSARAPTGGSVTPTGRSSPSRGGTEVVEGTAGRMSLLSKKRWARISGTPVHTNCARTRVPMPMNHGGRQVEPEGLVHVYACIATAWLMSIEIRKTPAHILSGRIACPPSGPLMAFVRCGYKKCQVPPLYSRKVDHTDGASLDVGRRSGHSPGVPDIRTFRPSAIGSRGPSYPPPTM